MQIKSREYTRKIVYTAFLTALCVVCNIFTIQVVPNVFVISFTAVPCFFAGVFISPIFGFLTGFMGDVLGHLIHPMGAYLLPLSIASGLLGFIPGLLFKYLKINSKIMLIGFSFLITFIICTIGINTTTLWFVYGKAKKTYWVYFVSRVPAQLAITAINATITAGLYPIISRLMKTKNFALSLSSTIEENSKKE